MKAIEAELQKLLSQYNNETKHVDGKSSVVRNRYIPITLEDAGSVV